ncbi:MAG: tetratricopeptide repeat protein [Alphaproteobacteria bacterium]|nr:tetratricopeptide repeat protein [Alphaproteobacteria bacterium]
MSYDLMLQKAIDLQNNGALNEAESIYLNMLQAMPENADVWNLLGLVAQSKGNLLRAVDCFLSAIKYSPRPFGMHYFNLALCYKGLNKPSEALEAFNRAVELSPEVKEGWNYLGVLQEELEKHNDAVKSFCKALELDNNYMEARANLCFYTKDYPTLIKLAEDNESDYMANLLASKCVDDFNKKEEFLQNAIKSAPYRVEPYILMAIAFKGIESFNNSLTYYFKALNLDDNNVEAILGVADCYLELKEYEKAEKYYKKSFDFRRDIIGAHLNYGVCLYKQKRLAEALEAYKVAGHLSYERPEVSYNTALILRELKEYEEALGLMFNAHLRDKENQLYAISIMETLAELYTQNAELALKIAENWQKLEPDNIFSNRILNGICGKNDVSSDKEFARALFDNFADSYEDTIEKLNSSIISEFKKIKGDVAGNILELGCGTGLAVDVLNNKKASFVGVDISSKMLEIADKRGVYKELICADIEDYLSKNSIKSKFDLVLAFDVFCYFGNLENIIKKLKGIECWFSIELADVDRKEDFYLTASGRYKHQKDYIEKIAKSVGFKEIEAHNVDLRQEFGEPVKGVLFKLK